MAFFEKRYFSKSSSHEKGNRQYVSYPAWFYPHAVFSDIITLTDLKPAHNQVTMGRLQYRRKNNEYLQQHIFFNSFMSLKTVPWLLQNRPDRYVKRPPDYWKYQSVFWNVKNIPNTAALLWTRSRPDKAVYSQSEKYRRSMYPSIFMKPHRVPDLTFSSVPSEEWTTEEGPSTTWTTTER